MFGRLTALALLAALPAAGPVPARAAEAEVGCVEVATRAPHNPVVPVWYRVPRGYDPSRRERWRVLVLFGGRNADGRPEVSGKPGWTAWADLNGVFLVSPTLRDDAYWEPEAWSGRALLDALDALAAKYRVAASGLLFYGYSAGSQAANLFPAWRPGLCRAYASHACGVFHAPSPKMRGVAGLVTCGDADVARYALGRRFFAASRARGLSVVWRSFPNRPHDVPEASARLAREFLAHHHWAHSEDLGGAPVPSPPAPFVGDDADDVYFPSDSPAASAVLPEDRVELPSETVAAAWGTPGLAADGGRREPRVSARTFRGVEVVFSVPDGVRADARVLVLLGGRGWTGAQALRDLGFADWALARGWCLLAPSFGDGGRDSRAAAEALSSALGDLRRRHGLRPYPVFLYGYSAGGELAALLQARPPFPVAAWAVHGCGVFPEAFRADAPALVSCGVGDEGRFGLSRTFACRYREAGGLLVWRTAWGGHEPDAGALALARELFAAVSAGAPCALWGEDDTRRVLPRARIDPEYANPLYTPAMAERWRRE